MELMPVSWIRNGDRTTTIDACFQEDGSTLYAVRQGRACLSVSGSWVYEPMPSNRDTKFYEQCRFVTIEDAVKAIEKQEQSKCP